MLHIRVLLPELREPCNKSLVAQDVLTIPSQPLLTLPVDCVHLVARLRLHLRLKLQLYTKNFFLFCFFFFLLFLVVIFSGLLGGCAGGRAAEDGRRRTLGQSEAEVDAACPSRKRLLDDTKRLGV